MICGQAGCRISLLLPDCCLSCLAYLNSNGLATWAIWAVLKNCSLRQLWNKIYMYNLRLIKIIIIHVFETKWHPVLMWNKHVYKLSMQYPSVDSSVDLAVCLHVNHTNKTHYGHHAQLVFRTGVDVTYFILQSNLPTSRICSLQIPSSHPSVRIRWLTEKITYFRSINNHIERSWQDVRRLIHRQEGIMMSDLASTLWYTYRWYLWTHDMT